MSYLNFTKITPAAPNDPVVNEVTQLNNNWDVLENQLTPYMFGGGSLTGIEQGQELFDSNFRFAVWDSGSSFIPDDIDAGWSAWTNLPLLSPRAIRSGFQPKWRNNSEYRMVELTGGVQFDASANPWTAGSLITVNGDVSGAVPSSMQPIGGYHVCSCATALSATTTVVSAGYAYIDKPVGNTFTRIRVQYLGGAGGGNFVMLDKIWWWY